MLSNSLNISVAICTFNGAKRIPEVLTAIARQQNIDPSEFEIILIDNASTDETKCVFKLFTEQNPDLLCRYLFESTPGLGFARNLAFREAAGKWICFVDDDNILASNFLSAALRYANSGIKIGTLGGKSVARLSSPPPEWFDSVKNGLAIWDGGEVQRQLNFGERQFGAGLIVNAEIGKIVADEPWILGGRTKNSLIAGEDSELFLKISRLGWKHWYAPELVFEHVIPDNRLTLQYLKELFGSFGATHLLLCPYYYPYCESKNISIIIILFSAILKLLWFLFLSMFSIKEKRKLETRVWSYSGVINHFLFALKRLNRFDNYIK